MQSRPASASLSDRNRVATGPAVRFFWEAGGRAALRGLISAAAMLAALGLPGSAMLSAKSLHPDYALRTGRIQAYGDWLAGCDGTGCTAIGIAQPGHERLGVIRIHAQVAVRLRWNNGGAGSTPKAELLPLPAPQDTALPRYRGPYRLDGLERELGWQRNELTGDQAALFLHLLARRGRLWGRSPDGRTVLVELPDGAGLRRLLPAIERALPVQARSAAQRLARPLSIWPGTETLVSGFLPLDFNERCPHPRDVRQFTLHGDVRLFSAACTADPQDRRRHLFEWRDKSRPAQPLDLPEPRLGPVRAGRDGLAEPVLALDFGIIASARFAGPGQDCGLRLTWGWTGTAWHLLERHEMPRCAGLAAKDWIPTYRAPATVERYLPDE